MMSTFMAIVVSALMVVWLCISICMLVSTIYSFICDRRQEKERAARESEYCARHAADRRK